MFKSKLKFLHQVVWNKKKLIEALVKVKVNSLYNSKLNCLHQVGVEKINVKALLATGAIKSP